MDEPIDEQEVFTHNKTLFVLNGAPMVFRMPRSEEESHLRVKRRLRAYVCVSLKFHFVAIPVK